jgi:DNA-binding beta-propeller fold protein YncE
LNSRQPVGAHLLLMFLLLSFSLSLPARGVKFLRVIDFRKAANKRSIGSLLLGRKERKEVRPGSLCFIAGNRLAVTDAVNGAVIIIEKDGTLQKQIIRFKGGRLVSPVSCCCDENGNLYLADSSLGLVLQFDSRFKFKRVFIAHPRSRITGMLYTQGYFFCVDTRNHRILCFDREGKWRFSLGQRGTGAGEFNFPTHIAADHDYIYITDAMNFRVQVVDRTGKFIRGFGRNGRGGGNFSKPKGLAVDREQRVYVADAMFDNVQIFNREGEFLYYFGSPGQQEGEFWMPSDVVVDSDGLIWVADTYNSRIQVFQLIKEGP